MIIIIQMTNPGFIIRIVKIMKPGSSATGRAHFYLYFDFFVFFFLSFHLLFLIFDFLFF